MSVIDDQRGVVTLCSRSVALSNVYNVAAEEKFVSFSGVASTADFSLSFSQAWSCTSFFMAVASATAGVMSSCLKRGLLDGFDLALALVLFLPRAMFAVLAVVDNLAVTVMGQKIQRVWKWIRRREESY